MNNRYKITIKDPLIRPGIIFETEVSEKYVAPVIETVLNIVRGINETKQQDVIKP